MKKIPWALLVGLFPLTLHAADQAGTVLYASGEVQVRNAAGQTEQPKKGDEISVGDTVITQRGRAHMRFKDGGMVALAPNTQFKVNQFTYSGKEDGSEAAFFELLRGGLRAVSGTIGHARSDRYKMQTVIATIGIRGSVYETELCIEGSCGPDQPDGQYVDSIEDEIFVYNGAGTTDMDAGDHVYVQDEETPPAEDNESGVDLNDTDDDFRGGETEPREDIIDFPPEPIIEPPEPPCGGEGCEPRPTRV